MQELELDGARVACDPEATRAATARMPHGAAEACGCAECREYIARRAGLLEQAPRADELHALLARLGCDPAKEWELCPLLRGLGGRRELLVAWRFRGEFLSAADAPDGALRSAPDGALRFAPGPADGSLLLELRLEYELPDPPG